MSLRERTSGTSEKQAALAALYETHFERVSRYISVRIGDFSEAEGLASEVFIRAVKAARPTTIGGRLWRHGSYSPLGADVPEVMMSRSAATSDGTSIFAAFARHRKTGTNTSRWYTSVSSQLSR